MNAIVTAKHDGTRFFLTDDGLATDRPERARTFNYSYDAQRVANTENTDDLWHPIRWYAAYMLHDGTIADSVDNLVANGNLIETIVNA